MMLKHIKTGNRYYIDVTEVIAMIGATVAIFILTVVAMK